MSHTPKARSLSRSGRLLLYTDGLLRTENDGGQSFREAALPTFIQETQGLGAEQFAELLLIEVLARSR
jgi:serine phosphatase RsbU (regulator of sigma subunit)